MSTGHLVRRFFGSLTATRLSAHEVETVRQILLPAEATLFFEFGPADQRHAMAVLGRFDVLQPTAPLAARRAALLHDIGKVRAPLGTFARVLATLFGPRTVKFAEYLDHERHGVELLRNAASDSETLALLRGEGDPVLRSALKEADEI